jgi:hypothetical protein
MGYDLSGRNPKAATPKPVMADWKTATEEEKHIYRTAMDEWETTTDGAYFRASMGWWSPILILSNDANKEYKLKINMDDWAYNDGGGCSSAKKCKLLADGIENIAPSVMPFWNEIADDKVIYCCTQYWEELTESRDIVKADESAIQKLNEMHHIYQFISEPAVIDGKKYVPFNRTKKSHIKQFTNFLRNCGGFNIY